MDEPEAFTSCEICTAEVNVTGQTPGVIVSCVGCGGPVIVPDPPAPPAAAVPPTPPEARPVTRGALFSSIFGRAVDEAQRRLPS